jgi:hypothetical protein
VRGQTSARAGLQEYGIEEGQAFGLDSDPRDLNPTHLIKKTKAHVKLYMESKVDGLFFDRTGGVSPGLYCIHAYF